MANVIQGGVGRAFEVYASAARTTSPDTVELELPLGARTAYFVIDCTAVASTPSVTFEFAAVDRVSGKKSVLITSAAITGTGTTTIQINDALTAGAAIAKAAVPPILRVTPTHADADSITYSVGGMVTG